MPGFAGLVPISNTLDITVVAKNSSNVPTDADSAPTYRIYGPSGFLSSGTLTTKDTGSITGASNANPTVITSNGHNLTTGTLVVITGVGGNTGANGTFQVTRIDSNTFSIPVDTTLGGTYTSGGTWHSAGVYDWNFAPTVGANYASGVVYTVYVYGLFSAVSTVIDVFEFQVT